MHPDGPSRAVGSLPADAATDPATPCGRASARRAGELVQRSQPDSLRRISATRSARLPTGDSGQPGPSFIPCRHAHQFNVVEQLGLRREHQSPKFVPVRIHWSTTRFPWPRPGVPARLTSRQDFPYPAFEQERVRYGAFPGARREFRESKRRVYCRGIIVIPNSPLPAGSPEQSLGMSSCRRSAGQIHEPDEW